MRFARVFALQIYTFAPASVIQINTENFFDIFRHISLFIRSLRTRISHLINIHKNFPDFTYSLLFGHIYLTVLPLIINDEPQNTILTS